ncbi:S8 family peptidase [Streptomyces sp. SDr-06]|uniref:S8 family peptidase n=1 Tax=Streptomyces sp. SDr-06 TaxID=2267702 RepID=UPI000DE9D5AC|nr:S8 family peptidase [Streptomyces sp. SDr-06]RCH64587.1 S8 family peptidase [Streptomyces sp. SDr-06]
MSWARRIAVGLTTLVVLTAGLSSGAAPVASAAPTGEGRTAKAAIADAVPGSYIVTFKESAPRADSAAGQAVARKYGATVKRTYHQAVNGYSVRASESQAERIAKDPAVASVSADRAFRVTGTQSRPPSWGLDRIDQQSLPLSRSYTYPRSAGSGVTAYIIDSGVRITHQDFGGRASYGYDAIEDDQVAQDGNGHGTHVAAIAAGSRYGVAKKAKIVAVRVLDDAGSGTTEQIVAGIDWVTRHAVKPAVANMSLSGGADAVVDQAVRKSIASGVTYTVAAGNDGQDASLHSPARVREAVTVGATTERDSRDSLSNHGAALDLFAPGESIASAWNGSDTSTITDSGTSMAAPHVAGAAALYLADHPEARPVQVASALTASATTGRVTKPGSGSPNRLLNIGRLR